MRNILNVPRKVWKKIRSIKFKKQPKIEIVPPSTPYREKAEIPESRKENKVENKPKKKIKLSNDAYMVIAICASLIGCGLLITFLVNLYSITTSAGAQFVSGASGIFLIVVTAAFRWSLYGMSRDE